MRGGPAEKVSSLRRLLDEKFFCLRRYLGLRSAIFGTNRQAVLAKDDYCSGRFRVFVLPVHGQRRVLVAGKRMIGAGVRIVNRITLGRREVAFYS